jgi:hypothetical protein
VRVEGPRSGAPKGTPTRAESTDLAAASRRRTRTQLWRAFLYFSDTPCYFSPAVRVGGRWSGSGSEVGEAPKGTLVRLESTVFAAASPPRTGTQVWRAFFYFSGTPRYLFPARWRTAVSGCGLKARAAEPKRYADARRKYGSRRGQPASDPYAAVACVSVLFRKALLLLFGDRSRQKCVGRGLRAPCEAGAPRFHSLLAHIANGRNESVCVPRVALRSSSPRAGE